MEYVEKYWYVVVGALILLYVLASRNSGGAQAGSGTAYTMDAAQLASSEKQADQQARFGLAQALLDYDLANKQEIDAYNLNTLNIQQQPQLLQMQFANQAQLAQLQFNAQQYQINAANELQRYTVDRAYNAQSRQDYLSALSTGLYNILPNLFGRTTNPYGYGGGGGLFGGSGGGYIFH